MARFKKACIEALAYELPETVVTSDEIEQRLAPLYERLGLPCGRLELMTGIRERRFFGLNTKPSEVSSLAAEKALALSSIPREDIGRLVHASVCRDFIEPATSTVVHHRLGLSPWAVNYDLSNACLGVLNGILDVANAIELGQIKAGLVVAGENGAPLVEATLRHLVEDTGITRKSFKNSFASLTIGSGAAAVIVADRELAPHGHPLVGAIALADTSGNDLCRGNADTGIGGEAAPLMETGSEELMLKGCALAGRTWEAALREMDWTRESIDRLFSHQVGTAHARLIYETISMERSRDFFTYEFLGNMGAVSWPITLALAAERDLIPPNARVMLMGIGSGINCVMAGVEW